jgi:dolichol-phosphate mannosyltransferase
MNDLLQINIPVYNESDSIVKVLEEIETKVTTPHQINIIFDFLEDSTLPVVRRYIQEKKARNICLVQNLYGKGVLNALKTGFDSVKEGVILVVMADSSDDLSVVDSMFELIQGGYDIICGSRYAKGGQQIGGPRLKGFLSRTAGISLHLLTGIPTHDISNSFKMYRQRVFQDMRFESSGGFEIGMEIVVKSYLKGYKITEVPSTWRDRSAGTSRFQLRKWLPKYVKWYLWAVNGRIKGHITVKP